MIAAQQHARDIAALSVAGVAAAFFFVAGTTNDDVLKMYVASLRIADGQLPYRDFFPQVLPLGNFLAAPFFFAVPPGGAALILAVGLNVFATLAMWRLTLIATGDRFAALVAGVLAAAWYLQIGGYYFDQLAYAFVLGAFLRYETRPAGAPAGATEGLLLAAAVLSKQSVGVFAAAAFCVAVIAFDGWRRLLRWRFVAAGAALVVAFALYLLATDGVAAFHTYAVVLQGDLAASQKNMSRLVTDFLAPWNVDPLDSLRNRQLGRLSFYPVALVVYASYLALLLHWRRTTRTMRRGYGFVLLSTVWAAATPGRLYAHVTFGFPVIAAMVAVLLAQAQWRRAALSSAAVLFVALAAVQGVRNGYYERPAASPVAVRALWPLRFEAPELQAIRVAAPLAQTGASYALFGGIFLNAVPMALARAPLDPMLFYEHISMIPRDPERRRAWEEMMIRRFEERQPAMLVIGFVPPDARRDAFTLGGFDGLPRWRDYVEGRYPAVIAREGEVSLRARR